MYKKPFTPTNVTVKLAKSNSIFVDTSNQVQISSEDGEKEMDYTLQVYNAIKSGVLIKIEPPAE